MYLAYPSKSALLNEIIRVGVRGDDAEIPLNQRRSWAIMLASESAAELLARLASGGTELMARAAAVLSLGEACATSDPQLAELRDRGHANIRSDMREVVAELEHRGVLARHSRSTAPQTSCSPSSPTRARTCAWPRNARGPTTSTPT